MPCQIEINQIELNLQIGCHEAERANAQVLMVDVKICNYQKFKASKTDLLEDTLDVSSVKKVVKELAQDQKVNTLERLAEILEQGLRKHFHQSGLTWELTLAKKNYSWKYVQSWST